MPDPLLAKVEKAIAQLDKALAAGHEVGLAWDVLDSIRMQMQQAPESHPPRTWEPRADAKARAQAAAQMIDVELHIDRYIIRCRERENQPSNTEWLRWFMDDEQKARIEARKDSQTQGVDTVGVPTTWH